MFRQATWTASAQGKYFASFPEATEGISGTIISCDIVDLYALRTTDVCQPMIKSNSQIQVMSNTNTFASDAAGLVIKITYI